jgi:hypothetical protein
MPKTIKPATLAEVAAIVHPAIFQSAEDTVITYMAVRQGVSMQAARHAIECDTTVKASFERKMLRMLAVMAGAGFKITKTQTPLVPITATEPEALPDVAAMLANIGKPKAV